MTDTMRIIVSPLDGARTDDAVQIRADCGHRAWIAPSGMNMVLNPIMRTETVCMRCVDPKQLLAYIREQGGLRSLPGGQEELRAAIGKDEADEVYRRFNVEEWDGR